MVVETNKNSVNRKRISSHLYSCMYTHIYIYIYGLVLIYAKTPSSSSAVWIRIRSRSSEELHSFSLRSRGHGYAYGSGCFCSLTVHGSELKQKQLRNSITGLAPNIHIYWLWLSCGNKLWSWATGLEWFTLCIADIRKPSRLECTGAIWSPRLIVQKFEWRQA